MPSMASPGLTPESNRVLQTQLRATLNVIPAYTWCANPSGGLTFVNERQADYLGLPKDHPLRFGIDIGAAWDSQIPFLHPDDHEEARRVWSTCLRTASAGQVSFRVRNAEGGYRWFLSRAEPLRATDGTLLYWIGVNLDIEERKQAEFYLAEGQRLAHTGSWGFNPAGFFDHWSRELFHIYGLNPAQKAPSLEEYLAQVHPQDREFMASLIKRMVAEASGCDVTKRIVRPNGKLRYVRCVGAPVVEDGALKRIVGTAMDVTEHEVLTQELQSREAYLAEAQRLTHTGSWVWNAADGSAEHLSEEWYRIYGFDPAKGAPVWEKRLERIHSEDRLRWKDTIERAILEKDYYDLDFRIVLPDSTIKWIHTVGHPVLSGRGDLLQFVGSSTDITERKKAEQKIREQEAELQQTLDFAPQLIAVYGPNRERLYANRVALDYLGLSLEEWCQDLDRGGVLHPDDRERVRKYTDRAVSSGAAYEQEFRLCKKDGSYRWFLARYNPVRDHKGQIRRWYVCCTDIEDRKQAEDRVRHENIALKRAEEKIREQEVELRQMLDLTPQYLGVLGADGTPIYANRTSLDYLGMSLDEWRQRGAIGDEVHPDDIERLARASSSGSAYELELRVRNGEGAFRWFVSRFSPLHDENGQISRWYVASTDIDDRKRAEERLKQENVALRDEIDQASMFEDIVGTSSPLQRVLSSISKVAPNDSTVLIAGETGTGKELVARAIHKHSQRSQHAFISVNCAAIPRDLIASELFGHEKGAFTGAMQQRLGRFELASRGTIFLDEVGELPAETQIALLRVLQEREFERVGGTRRIRADVRVIAATNRDLEAAIRAGSFRSDLFYRLNVFPIKIPALRERKEDIPLLVEYFIDRYARKQSKNIRRVQKKTLELLQSYSWPGNVRELQNVIERSVILCETEAFSIDESWLPQQPIATVAPQQHTELPRRLEAQEKEMIEAALKEARGRVSGPTGAAAKLGLPRSTLESKIRSLKINKNRFTS